MRVIVTFVHKNKLTIDEIRKLTAYRGSNQPDLHRQAYDLGGVHPSQDYLSRFTWFSVDEIKKRAILFS